MDLNTGLTQPLSDGTNTYIYGAGRIAQMNTSTEYFLGDALGSVRQLTDDTGEITYARAYDPYGVVTSTLGDSQTSYAFTGEHLGDSTQLTYLRSRYYSSGTGRFLTRDTWGGDYNRPLSLNRWMYTGGNPINFTDPSGHFPQDLIFKNIDYYDFEHPKHPILLNYGTTRTRYGFLALLLEADNFDVIGVGYLQLQKSKPTVAYNLGLIYTDCETIFVDGLPLKYFYETKVKNQNEPWIWWRDTSASYYQLNNRDTYVDGDFATDLPSFHSIDIGAIAYNIDIVADLDGNFYASVAGGLGVSGGFSYTESYLCQNSECVLNIDYINNLISGFCVSHGGQIAEGYAVSICSPASPNQSFVMTYSVGYEAGYNLIGGSYTILLSSIIPRNPEFGWRRAIGDRRNGIHRSDLHLSP